MKIVDGKKVAERILKKLKSQIGNLRKRDIVPKLAVVLVGNDEVSLNFIRKKEEFCLKVGADFELFKFPGNIKEKILSDKIKVIQNDKSLSGLVVQLPLPEHLSVQKILDQIDPELDADCLTSFNLGKLAAGISEILPPTPAAILELFKSYKVSFLGKHIVIVGKGKLVGQSLNILLARERSTVTICGKYTKDLGFFTRQADILVSAVGKANLISEDMVKRGVVILDAGTSFRREKLIGDVDFPRVSKKASLISPVPGGVGPVTVVKLLENIVKCARRSRK
jgi:methylenetetrahydrofolate dehydrogenase (NADP+)/methenyltetrahydrofolate cyclohydrolase